MEILQKFFHQNRKTVALINFLNLLSYYDLNILKVNPGTQPGPLKICYFSRFEYCIRPLNRGEWTQTISWEKIVPTMVDSCSMPGGHETSFFCTKKAHFFSFFRAYFKTVNICISKKIFSRQNVKNRRETIIVSNHHRKRQKPNWKC